VREGREDLPSAGATDFAFLLTGQSEEFDWGLEAGVISHEELAPRVLRQIGSYSGIRGSEVVLDGAPKAPVSFFVTQYGDQC